MKGKSPAEDRVEALTTKAESDVPEPGQASQRLQEQKRADEKSAKSGKPVLTEKQRIEARQRRRTKKRRPMTGNVLSRGLRATINEVHRTFLFLGRSVLGGLDRIKPLGGVIVSGAAGLLRAIGRGAAAVAALAGTVLKALGRVLLALDRVVTTRRGLIVIALAAGGLLVVSQFLDFRAIEVGQPGYVDVQEITRAPRLEAETPLDNHSLLLVVAGVLAVLAAAGAALTRKRVTGLVLALAGAVALAIALLIDLPAGLDTADAELAFSGVKGVLLSGFWLEVGAGAVLLVSGIGLVLDAPAPKRARTRQRHTVNSPATGSRA
ncbi:MAG: hypothetical protein JJE13_13685 [Thermoleophilia bacterium]|nr:hypothetical protein [Thermoleophilia bacterium]